MSPDKTCKHEGCNCATPKDRNDGYCSDYCANHAAKPAHAKHACACPHGGCGQTATA